MRLLSRKVEPVVDGAQERALSFYYTPEGRAIKRSLEEQLRLTRAEARYQLERAVCDVGTRVTALLGAEWAVENNSDSELSLSIRHKGTNDFIQVITCDGEVRLMVLGQSTVGLETSAVAGSFYLGAGRLLADAELLRWLGEMVAGDAVWRRKQEEVERLCRRLAL